MSEARKTPLYETHRQQGGRLVEYAGWWLPVQYAGILEEHRAVRQAAGLFDVSHMGEFWVSGVEALPFLQQLLTNDASRLEKGQVLYSPLCYEDGGTVDDVLVYRLDKGYLLVVNAANTDKDEAWLRQWTAGHRVAVENVSASWAQLALQGPRAQAVLQALTAEPLEKLGSYHCREGVTVAGEEVLLSRTGYTGEDGFELYCAPAAAPALWRAVLAAGGVVPAGLGARDTLRLEAALPLYGHELTPAITPLEAGLGRFVSLDKGDFCGRAVLRDEKANGTARVLVGLELTERGIPRAGYGVWQGKRQVGEVTSGSFAPTLGRDVALALVAKEALGQELAVDIRGRRLAARQVPRPFYRRKG